MWLGFTLTSQLRRMAAAAVRMASPASSSTKTAGKQLQKMLQRDALRAGDSDEDDDKGEGTSAAGAALAGLSAKHLDIAALLKDPLVFIPPRLADDSQSKIPYDPLPTGPVKLQSLVCSVATLV